ncbi:ADP-ribose pyrophosphatase YjhB, NUDIX family [Pedobacter antarcticus]|uniref:ADP-ribose pyrophosphatase YjhB, NUDIX family n=1 Tax=Pedobacter antarcticus TaxID=34086 RepID=A0A1I2FLF4_9SPHI|nr:NUDIX domain-containing protein [Pedobacter antarcticus]SFF06115.1 ADP-ribose pyrophosphatase YjhB, NUDIX family [Pedobacter antarcticus]
MIDTNIIKLHTAGLVVLRDEKLLLAYSRNKKAWYLPGGKIDQGETSLEAIQREIKEELDIDLVANNLKLYTHITAPAFGENTNIQMEQDCFLYKLTEEIKPTNEIEEVAYFNLETYLSEPVQVPGVISIFKQLIADRLISE